MLKPVVMSRDERNDFSGKSDNYMYWLLGF